jgi:DNA-binding XRE family transcriptional regulator
MEYSRCVYLPLNLENLTARKLYKLSRLKELSIIDLVEDIVKKYLEDIQVEVWTTGEAKRPTIEQENIRKEIGLKIAYLRQINCLSQKRLGEILSLDQQSMSQIELGKRRLDIVEAMAIAQVLGVELSEII